MTMNREDLAGVLRDALVLKGWSIADLAKNAGVSYESARRALKGIGSIELETVTKLLVAVGRQLEISEVKSNASES